MISYGKSKEFPAFFSRRSGYSVSFSNLIIFYPLNSKQLQVPWNTNDPRTAARILRKSPETIALHRCSTFLSDTQQQLGMQNGALIAVPIPQEYEAVGEEIQRYVNQAVRESEENGVSASGNDATPWLLNRIAELSGGKSLTSNIALLRNTALVGEGQLYLEFCH